MTHFPASDAGRLSPGTEGPCSQEPMMDGPQEVATDTKEILDGAVHRTGCGDPAAERRLACLAARGSTFACAPGEGLAPAAAVAPVHDAGQGRPATGAGRPDRLYSYS